MGLATVQTERRLPFAPDALCRLVGDVRAYPGFLPWVQAIDVVKEERIGEGWRGLARADIGWRSIRERFATFVECRPEDGAVEVRLADGPFKRLENRWRFRPDGEGGSIVDFWIAYEFKSRILQALASANRDRAAARIIGAFEAEAARRLAPVLEGSAVDRPA
jgi:coenzyme Q-binding protein COQ10